jgi:hypothetical protein
MTKPYVITKQPVVKAPLAGMAKWVELCCKHSDGSLWNNGIWVVRDMRGKPGIVSNHARGLATDVSYRWQAQKNKGVKDGRKQSLAYIVKLLEHADTLGIQLVIDYALKRSWKCDRGTWQPLPSVDEGDWYHIEIEPRLAHDPEATKQAFQAVFGLSPKAAPQSV